MGGGEPRASGGDAPETPRVARRARGACDVVDDDNERPREPGRSAHGADRDLLLFCSSGRRPGCGVTPFFLTCCSRNTQKRHFVKTAYPHKPSAQVTLGRTTHLLARIPAGARSQRRGREVRRRRATAPGCTRSLGGEVRARPSIDARVFDFSPPRRPRARRTSRETAAGVLSRASPSSGPRLKLGPRRRVPTLTRPCPSFPNPTPRQTLSPTAVPPARGRPGSTRETRPRPRPAPSSPRARRRDRRSRVRANARDAAEVRRDGR